MSSTNTLRIVVLAIVLGGIALALTYRVQFDAAALESRVRDAGAAGPLLFMAIYTLGTVFFLPGSVMTLAGGALFGPVAGALYAVTGATIGATLAFLVTRYLAANWVEQRVGGRLQRLKEGVEEEGWRFVAFVRLVPLFPFNLLNYALGLTRIKLSHYIIASYVCMVPGAVAYTYLGYAGREAFTGSDGLIQKALLALSLLAVVAFIPRLITRLRRPPMLAVEDLKQQLHERGDILVLDVRTAGDFRGDQGHIAAAINIPLEELEPRLAELVEYQQRPIATVCRTDRRSTKAAQLLARKGYARVHVVKGGMTAWNERCYRIE